MKRRIRLTEGDLRRIVNKSVRRVLREGLDGLFEIFISNSNRPDIAYVNEEFYEIPKGDVWDLQTRDGRQEFLDTINQGGFNRIDIQANGFEDSADFYSWLKSHGYRVRHYNASAW